MKIVVIVFLIMQAVSSFASVEVVELNNYEDVLALVIDKTDDFKKTSTQIVFDLDNTVIRGNECDAVKDIENGFQRFIASVRDCDAVMTSWIALDLIEVLKDAGYPVMAMTARPYKFGMLVHTFRQLENLKEVDGAEKTVQVSFETAPSYSKDFLIIPYKVSNKKGELKDKEIAYQKGVSFVPSGNKGLALQAFNKHVKKRYRNIIFIDDDKKNIRHLKEAYKNSKRAITIVHYTEYVDAE